MNTTSTQDVFRKVGRGGAGNFHAAKKQDELAAEKDPERQDMQLRPVVVTMGASNFCAGRGGAGNFVDAVSTAREVSQAASSPANLTRHAPHGDGCGRHRSNRMGGRGGAGNWAGERRGGADALLQGDRHDDAASRTTMDELEREVAEAVERGLRIPERVHHGRQKDVQQ